MKHEGNEGKEVGEGWQGGLEVDWINRRGAASLSKKIGAVWLVLRAEFPVIKEEQFKRAFDRNARGLKYEELGTRSLWREAHFRF